MQIDPGTGQVHSAPLAGIAERDRILALLRREAPALRAAGVRELRLFGSIARGEAGPESDVDLLARLDSTGDRKLSILDLLKLEEKLSVVVGRQVEIVTAAEKLRRAHRDRIDREAIEVIGAVS